MLRVNGRVLEDAFRSGFIRGTVFKNAQGHWAIDWRLGGQPIVHIVIPYMFMFISLLGGISCLIYLAKKYYSFRRLKRVVTYLRQPKNFGTSISVSVVAVTLLIFLVGFIGTTTDPNIIIPAKPSKDYLEVNLKITASCYVEITRPVIVETVTDILDRNNMTGWFYCIIKTPENALWKVSDIEISNIVLNDKIQPFDTSLYFDGNDTAYMIAMFDKKSLAFLFEGQDSLELDVIPLTVKGKLKNGDYFAGSSYVKIV